MCKKPWGTHTHTQKKTWNKLERSRVLSHSFTTDANAPLLFEMRVCFTEWHCSSWPSRVVRDYLSIIRILDSMSSLTIICLEYGLGYAILSAFSFVQAILSIQFSLHLERGTLGGRGTRTPQKKVNEHRITVRKVGETPSSSHTVRFEITANWAFIHRIKKTSTPQHRKSPCPPRVHIPR